MKKLISLYCFTLFLTSACLAQQDSSYISSFQRKNFLQLYAGSFTRSIEFVPQDKKGMPHQILLSPNSSAFCGFVLGYKKITLYGDIAIPQTSKVSRRQSDVKAASFFLSHFKYKWGVTGFLSYNRGLLMAQDNMFMMYSNRNDLRKFTTGAHFYRIFNPARFSFIAANSHQMQQKKSAGSFILSATPSYRIMQSAFTIIPVEISKYHLNGKMEMNRRIQLYSFQLKPGYAYNFTMKGGEYFIAPSLFTGTGADYHFITQTTGQNTGFNFNLGYRAKLTAGINKSRLYATVEYLVDHTRSYLYQSTVKNTYRECTLNVGWRF
jgi:Domain of unknown function (DUF4421)